jgi:hypothetical protein
VAYLRNKSNRDTARQCHVDRGAADSKRIKSGESLAADGAPLLGLIGRLPTLDAPTGLRKDSD